jgi:flavodoxin
MKRGFICLKPEVWKGSIIMGKNSVIVYYSWVGNTKAAAEEIQALTGFDLLKIEEKKERKLGHIMGAAMSAFLGLRSSIKPMDFSLEKYDSVFLGTPVWAGKTPPAVNKFLSKANFTGKKVWLFITKADEKIPQKVIDSITSRIENKCGKVMDCLSLTTKWDPKTNIPITAEEIRSTVQNWVEKANLK